MPQEEYMTVGQLARKTGVTVRTIQYYDQQGLLSPSAKGAQNQRLYLNSDAADLYKILALKYLGLSLSDIKQCMSDCDNPSVFQTLVNNTMKEIQGELRETLHKLTALSSLLMIHDTADDPAEAETVNWKNVIDTIEHAQEDDLYFWCNDSTKSKDSESSVQGNDRKKAQSIGEWHELIANALLLMGRHVPADDRSTRGLAERYKQLSDTGNISDAFVLMENIAPLSQMGQDGSFESLRTTIADYLERALDTHVKPDSQV